MSFIRDARTRGRQVVVVEIVLIAKIAPKLPLTLEAVTDAINAADKYRFVSSIERTGPYTFLVEVPFFGNNTLVQEFITKLIGQIFGGWILSAELA